ncbi:hypothetical protein NY547_03095 [Cnuibacter physcomitrellae]|uniref:acyl-CoA carboxylase epsilon subunit n=1 Tax=Cnuibacter physcomitrellae TaxID=1619308 RepID=UPI002175E52C|nr:acyl-CoA carboxylase epsilon subunit [Cnuibacter physcomitrellae]MCS5496224.1 hypothetical protein [Cnuibacter physcomitrellae]
MTDSTAQHPQSGTDSGIRVLTAGVTAEEVAAVTVVVEAAVAAELESIHDEPAIAPSAWSHSQRALRQPLQPGRHAWRSFGGA